MKTESLKEIDSIMKASELIEFLEAKKELAETRYCQYVRSDGNPRKGQALACLGLSNSIQAVDTVLRWIEQELRNRIEHQ